MVSKIIKTSRRLKPDEALFILEEVTHYINFNRKYLISASDFNQVVDRYNEEYDEDINSKEIYEVCIE